MKIAFCFIIIVCTSISLIGQIEKGVSTASNTSSTEYKKLNNSLITSVSDHQLKIHDHIIKEIGFVRNNNKTIDLLLQIKGDVSLSYHFEINLFAKGKNYWNTTARGIICMGKDNNYQIRIPYPYDEVVSNSALSIIAKNRFYKFGKNIECYEDYNNIVQLKPVLVNNLKSTKHTYVIDSINVYTRYEVDIEPIFVHTDEDMNDFIKSNLKTPISTNSDKIAVSVRFIIKYDGTIGGVEVHNENRLIVPYNEEAIRLVKSMPKWLPGVRENKLVSTLMWIEIPFY